MEEKKVNEGCRYNDEGEEEVEGEEAGQGGVVYGKAPSNSLD